MTIQEKTIVAGGMAMRAAMHTGFGPIGEFLAKPLDEKLKVLTESPFAKLPRMLDAGDRAFWEHMSGRAP